MSANTITTKSNKIASSGGGGFLNWVSQYDSLVIFGGLGFALFAIIILTGIFHAGPVIRDNILFNTIGGIMLGALFIFIVFKFMGKKIIVLGKTFEIGFIIYVFIVVFVIFVFGN